MGKILFFYIIFRVVVYHIHLVIGMILILFIYSQVVALTLVSAVIENCIVQLAVNLMPARVNQFIIHATEAAGRPGVIICLILGLALGPAVPQSLYRAVVHIVPVLGGVGLVVPALGGGIVDKLIRAVQVVDLYISLAILTSGKFHAAALGYIIDGYHTLDMIRGHIASYQFIVQLIVYLDIGSAIHAVDIALAGAEDTSGNAYIASPIIDISGNHPASYWIVVNRYHILIVALGFIVGVAAGYYAVGIIAYYLAVRQLCQLVVAADFRHAAFHCPGPPWGIAGIQCVVLINAGVLADGYIVLVEATLDLAVDIYISGIDDNILAHNHAGSAIAALGLYGFHPIGVLVAALVGIPELYIRAAIDILDAGSVLLIELLLGMELIVAGDYLSLFQVDAVPLAFDDCPAVLAVNLAHHIDVGHDWHHPLLAILHVVNSICSCHSRGGMTANDVDIAWPAIANMKLPNAQALVLIGPGNGLGGGHGLAVIVNIAPGLAYLDVMHIQGQAGLVVYGNIRIAIGCHGAGSAEVVRGNIDVGTLCRKVCQIQCLYIYITCCINSAAGIPLYYIGVVDNLHEIVVLCLVAMISISALVLLHELGKLISTVQELLGVLVGGELEVSYANITVCYWLAIGIQQLQHLAQLPEGLVVLVLLIQLVVVLIRHEHYVVFRHFLMLGLVVILGLAILILGQYYHVAIADNNLLHALLAYSYAAVDNNLVILSFLASYNPALILLYMGLAISPGYIAILIPVVHGSPLAGIGGHSFLATVGVIGYILICPYLAIDINPVGLGKLVFQGWGGTSGNKGLVVNLGTGIQIQGAQLIVGTLVGKVLYLALGVNFAIDIYHIAAADIVAGISIYTAGQALAIFCHGLVAYGIDAAGGEGNILLTLQLGAGMLVDGVIYFHVQASSVDCIAGYCTGCIYIGIVADFIGSVSPVGLLPLGIYIAQVSGSLFLDGILDLCCLDIGNTLAIALDDVLAAVGCPEAVVVPGTGIYPAAGLDGCLGDIYMGGVVGLIGCSSAPYSQTGYLHSICQQLVIVFVESFGIDIIGDIEIAGELDIGCGLCLIIHYGSPWVNGCQAAALALGLGNGEHLAACLDGQVVSCQLIYIHIYLDIVGGISIGYIGALGNQSSYIHGLDVCLAGGSILGNDVHIAAPTDNLTIVPMTLEGNPAHIHGNVIVQAGCGSICLEGCQGNAAALGIYLGIAAVAGIQVYIVSPQDSAISQGSPVGGIYLGSAGGSAAGGQACSIGAGICYGSGPVVVPDIDIGSIHNIVLANVYAGDASGVLLVADGCICYGIVAAYQSGRAGPGLGYSLGSIVCHQVNILVLSTGAVLLYMGQLGVIDIYGVVGTVLYGGYHSTASDTSYSGGLYLILQAGCILSLNGEVAVIPDAVFTDSLDAAAIHIYLVFTAAADAGYCGIGCMACNSPLLYILAEIAVASCLYIYLQTLNIGAFDIYLIVVLDGGNAYRYVGSQAAGCPLLHIHGAIGIGISEQVVSAGCGQIGIGNIGGNAGFGRSCLAIPGCIVGELLLGRSCLIIVALGGQLSCCPVGSFQALLHLAAELLGVKALFTILAIAVGFSQGSAQVVDAYIGGNACQSGSPCYALGIQETLFVGPYIDILCLDIGLVNIYSSTAVYIVDSYANSGTNQASSSGSVGAAESHVVLGIDGSLATLCLNVVVFHIGGYGILHTVDGNIGTGTSSNAQGRRCGNVLSCQYIHIVGLYLYISIGPYLGVGKRGNGGAGIPYSGYAGCTANGCCTYRCGIAASGGIGSLVGNSLDICILLGNDIHIVYSSLGKAGKPVDADRAGKAYAYGTAATNAYAMLLNLIVGYGCSLYGEAPGIKLTTISIFVNLSQGLPAEGVVVYGSGTGYTGYPCCPCTGSSHNAFNLCIIVGQHSHISCIFFVNAVIYNCIENLCISMSGNLIDAYSGIQVACCGTSSCCTYSQGNIVEFLLAVGSYYQALLIQGGSLYLAGCLVVGIFRNGYGIPLSQGSNIGSLYLGISVAADLVYSYSCTSAAGSGTCCCQAYTAPIVANSAVIICLYYYIFIGINCGAFNLGNYIIVEAVDTYIATGISSTCASCGYTQANADIGQLVVCMGLYIQILHIHLAVLYLGYSIAIHVDNGDTSLEIACTSAACCYPQGNCCSSYISLAFSLNIYQCLANGIGILVFFWNVEAMVIDPICLTTANFLVYSGVVHKGCTVLMGISNSNAALSSYAGLAAGLDGATGGNGHNDIIVDGLVVYPSIFTNGGNIGIVDLALDCLMFGTGAQPVDSYGSSNSGILGAKAHIACNGLLGGAAVCLYIHILGLVDGAAALGVAVYQGLGIIGTGVAGKGTLYGNARGFAYGSPARGSYRPDLAVVICLYIYINASLFVLGSNGAAQDLGGGNVLYIILCPAHAQGSIALVKGCLACGSNGYRVIICLGSNPVGSNIAVLNQCSGGILHALDSYGACSCHALGTGGNSSASCGVDHDGLGVGQSLYLVAYDLAAGNQGIGIVFNIGIGYGTCQGGIAGAARGLSVLGGLGCILASISCLGICLCCIISLGCLSLGQGAAKGTGNNAVAAASAFQALYHKLLYIKLGTGLFVGLGLAVLVLSYAGIIAQELTNLAEIQLFADLFQQAGILLRRLISFLLQGCIVGGYQYILIIGIDGGVFDLGDGIVLDGIGSYCTVNAGLSCIPLGYTKRTCQAHLGELGNSQVTNLYIGVFVAQLAADNPGINLIGNPVNGNSCPCTSSIAGLVIA